MQFFFKTAEPLQKKEEKLYLKDLFPEQMPMNVLAFNYYLPTLEKILQELSVDYVVGTERQTTFNYEFTRSDSLQISANFFGLITSIFLQEDRLKNRLDQEQALARFSAEVLNSFCIYAINKLKTRLFSIKKDVLSFIIERLDQSKKHIPHYLELKIKEMSRDNEAKLAQAEIEAESNKNMYKQLTNKEPSGQLILLSEEAMGSMSRFLKTLKNSNYIKFLEKQSLAETLKNISITAKYSFNLKDKKPSLSLGLKIGNSSIRRKNVLLIQHTIENAFCTFSVLNHDLAHHRCHVANVVSLIEENLRLLKPMRNKYHYCHENFIELLSSIFRQLDDILENLTQIQQKQVEFINLLGYLYVSKWELDYIDDSFWTDLIQNLQELTKNEKN